MKASRPHDEAMVELLREDPGFADEYLAASMEAMNEPGGHEALLMALRQVAQAQGWTRWRQGRASSGKASTAPSRPRATRP